MNYDPYESCPYDEAHLILRSRMAFHLTRCSKNHTKSKKKQCPFDARHVVDPQNYEYHINNCPSRESVYHYKIRDPVPEPNLVPVPTAEELITANAPYEENWDDDIEVKTYNPLQRIKDKPILCVRIGAPKSERKKFRMEQRLKFQQIDIENEKKAKQKPAQKYARNSSKPTFQILESVSEKSEKEFKPLRRPKTRQSSNLNSNPMNDSNDDSMNVKTESNQNSTTQKTNGGDAFLAALKAEQSTKPAIQNGLTKLSSMNESEKKNTNTGAIPKVPFSYAAALNKTASKSKSISANTTIDKSLDSSYNVVIEKEVYDNEKENISDTSFVSCTTNNSIIEKLLQDVHNLSMDAEGFEKKRRPLNETLSKLINECPKESTINENFQEMNKSERPSRCAANFTNLN